MGEHDARSHTDAEELRLFTKRLLNDLHALEQMLEEGMIESDAQRIGAEQEVFLVDRHGRPAPRAIELLERIDDPHFTTELASYNLEFNLDPQELAPDCLSTLEERVDGFLERAREAAAELDLDIVLTGILPTLAKADLSLENMAPVPRYFALNEAMNRIRGECYRFRIKGRDELIITHDNVMLESCNTSFQLHLQTPPDDFVRLYNIAQAVAAPVLAAATNSPLLFGRCLWRETRIALFQQSLDLRAAPSELREQAPRVTFGRQWVEESALEIFREDIARFRILLSSDEVEDPFALLEEGRAPGLHALCLHNGTVYRWNRPCYGVFDGRPHLRIENRVLPAGPTVRDEVANAAFWFGLMRGVSDAYGDVTEALEFDTVKENFVAGARLGLGAQFGWVDRPQVPADELILDTLLGLARDGLDRLGIAAGERDRYLGVIEERVATGRTGSQWLLDSYRKMGTSGSRSERLAALVVGTSRRQRRGEPVARWDVATLDEAGGWKEHYLEVGQLMTTDLFTVNEDELVDLVAYLMNWKHIRHVPVEDSYHRLVGLVTHRSILRIVAQNIEEDRDHPIPVSQVMQRDVITVRPETPTLDALRLMKHHRVSCLPVVDDQEVLVGIITERDFMGIAGQLLEEFLASGGGVEEKESRES